jgi:hypothetical protein
VNINVFASSGSGLFAGRHTWPVPVSKRPTPGGVFRSTDNGRSWELLSSGLPVNPQVYSLVAHGQDVFVGIDPGLYYSTVNGDKWTYVGQGLPDLLILSIFINDSDVFVGMDAGGIWKRPLSEITEVKQPISPTMPASFKLEQNYPNPFNPTTVVSYQLPTNSFISLEVYDVLGKKVKTLVSERQNAGAHLVTFNADGLSSGVYFYRLSNGSFVATKKLMLIK